jgi:hypothetical protein
MLYDSFGIKLKTEMKIIVYSATSISRNIV